MNKKKKEGACASYQKQHFIGFKNKTVLSYKLFLTMKISSASTCALRRSGLIYVCSAGTTNLNYETFSLNNLLPNSVLFVVEVGPFYTIFTQNLKSIFSAIFLIPFYSKRYFPPLSTSLISFLKHGLMSHHL